MINCDLCNAVIGSDARRFSAEQMRIAVRQGLRPAGEMELLALAFGISTTDANADWVRRVMGDTSDWALCTSCVPRMESYLGTAAPPRTGAVVASAPPPPSPRSSPPPSAAPASSSPGLGMDAIASLLGAVMKGANQSILDGLQKGQLTSGQAQEMTDAVTRGVMDGLLGTPATAPAKEPLAPASSTPPPETPAAEVVFFPCGSCPQKMRAPASIRGKRVKCPKCGTISKVPLAEERSPVEAVATVPAETPKQTPKEAPKTEPLTWDRAIELYMEAYRSVVGIPMTPMRSMMAQTLLRSKSPDQIAAAADAVKKAALKEGKYAAQMMTQYENGVWEPH